MLITSDRKLELFFGCIKKSNQNPVLKTNLVDDF
jgi:hypothetical protein